MTHKTLVHFHSAYCGAYHPNFAFLHIVLPLMCPFGQRKHGPSPWRYQIQLQLQKLPFPAKQTQNHLFVPKSLFILKWLDLRKTPLAKPSALQNTNSQAAISSYIWPKSKFVIEHPQPPKKQGWQTTETPMIEDFHLLKADRYSTWFNYKDMWDCISAEKNYIKRYYAHDSWGGNL